MKIQLSYHKSALNPIKSAINLTINQPINPMKNTSFLRGQTSIFPITVPAEVEAERMAAAPGHGIFTARSGYSYGHLLVLNWLQVGLYML